MRCVDCEKHKYQWGIHFCEVNPKRIKRISDEDAHKDVPCFKYNEEQAFEEYKKILGYDWDKKRKIKKK